VLPSTVNSVIAPSSTYKTGPYICTSAYILITTGEDFEGACVFVCELLLSAHSSCLAPLYLVYEFCQAAHSCSLPPPTHHTQTYTHACTFMHAHKQATQHTHAHTHSLTHQIVALLLCAEATEQGRQVHIRPARRPCLLRTTL
jgi:hypothetical protein